AGGARRHEPAYQDADQRDPAGEAALRDEHGADRRHQQQRDDLGLGEHQVVAPGGPLGGRRRRRLECRGRLCVDDWFGCGGGRKVHAFSRVAPSVLYRLVRTTVPPSWETVKEASSANAATASSRCTNCSAMGARNARLKVPTTSCTR